MPKFDTYDLSPLLEAEAVREKAATFGEIQVIPIPGTQIPSPLVSNIHPQDIKVLKETLVGNGKDLPGEDGGHEVWESWKRAWDLWNNHYIEGRVNPAWVQDEYERLSRKFEGNAAKRWNRRRRARLRRGSEQSKRKLLPDYDSYRRVAAEREELPPPQHGLKWAKTNFTSVRSPTIEKVKRLVKRKTGKIVKEQQRVEKVMQVAERIRVRKGDKYDEFEERYIFDDLTVITTKPARPQQLAGYQSSVDARMAGQNISPINDANAPLESTDAINNTVKVKKLRMRIGNEDFVVEALKPGLYSHGDIHQRLEKDGTLFDVMDQNEADTEYQRNRPKRYLPDTIQVKTGEVLVAPRAMEVIQFHWETVEVDEWHDVEEEIEVEEEVEVEKSPVSCERVPVWMEVDDATNCRKGNHIGQDGDSSMLDADEVDLDLSDLDATDSEIDDDGVLPKSIPPISAEKAQDLDGSSGGFLPMKLFPEYKDPEVDADGQYIEQEDHLANTVWRPRWVGEGKEVIIENDECFEDWMKDNKLQIHGAVDCGRTPYPLLRPVDEYMQTTSGAFIKYKLWDRVTSTIFNMPILPRNAKDDPKDVQMEKKSRIYGDYMRDQNFQSQYEFFPLDIRRARRVDPKTGKPVMPLRKPLLRNDELFWVQYPWPNRGIEVLHEKDDPYWVTPEQRDHIDKPSRRYPPRQVQRTGELIPYDEKPWGDELAADNNNDAMYFLTNLHGGTLIVNGQGVMKGRVAGPLPSFAVIICPGGQVAFWFGPGGRYYLEKDDAAEKDYTTQWHNLRSLPGWEKVGLTAGQVWNQIIWDRLRREAKGQPEKDDEQWEIWKSEISIKPACTEGNYSKNLDPFSPHVPPYFICQDSTKDINSLPLDAVYQSEALETEQDEVDWLYRRVEPLRTLHDEAFKQRRAKTNKAIAMPPDEGVWPGETPALPDCEEVEAQQMADMDWPTVKEGAEKGQRALVKKFNAAKAKRAAASSEKVNTGVKKRKAQVDAKEAEEARKRQKLDMQLKAIDPETWDEDDAAQTKTEVANLRRQNPNLSETDARNEIKKKKAAKNLAQLAGINSIRDAKGLAPLSLHDNPTAEDMDRDTYDDDDEAEQEEEPHSHDYENVQVVGFDRKAALAAEKERNKELKGLIPPLVRNPSCGTGLQRDWEEMRNRIFTPNIGKRPRFEDYWKGGDFDDEVEQDDGQNSTIQGENNAEDASENFSANQNAITNNELETYRMKVEDAALKGLSARARIASLSIEAQARAEGWRDVKQFLAATSSSKIMGVSDFKAQFAALPSPGDSGEGGILDL